MDVTLNETEGNDTSWITDQVFEVVRDGPVIVNRKSSENVRVNTI